MRILWPIAKLSVGGSAVFLAIDQGLFSYSQKETVENAKKVTESLPVLDPYLKKIPLKVSKNDLKQYWNTGVKVTIIALASFPEDSKRFLQNGLNYVKNEVQNQMKNTAEK